MNKEEFKENVLFNIYKDQVVCNADWLRTRVDVAQVDVARLHRKIVNYQIDTYGQSLYKKVRCGVDYADTKKHIVEDGKKGRRKRGKHGRV